MPKTLVSVKNLETDEVLFTCPIEEIEQAYSYAADMESLGLNIVLDAPAITQTLAESLGVQGEELENFKDSVREEIEDHDGSCCVESPKEDEAREIHP